MAEGCDRSGHLRSYLRTAAQFLNQIRVLPLLLPYSLSSAQEIIDLDVQRWLAEIDYRPRDAGRGVLYLLSSLPEFRNLFYYRVGQGNLVAEILMRILRVVYREHSSLSIACGDIGPGLFIQHGVGTFIYAKSIGANCWINQQVTIGYLDEGELPTLGNNVFVFVGARVLGDITIGDNVRIGANAVVVKNVPDNCTVVGIPARIVKKDGIRVDEPL